MAKNQNNAPTDEWEEQTSEWKAWDPAPGDSIQGVYVSQKTFEGDNGPFLGYIIETDAGLMSISGGALDEPMQKVPLGGRVKISYHGMKKVKSGRLMKDFKLFTPKGQAKVAPESRVEQDEIPF